MTIYCSTTTSLPIAAMAALCDGAKFLTQPTDGPVSQYVYQWPDFTIQINVMPQSEVVAHIAGLIGYLRNLERATGTMLHDDLVRRIRETKLVLGFVTSAEIEEESHNNRLQDAIGMICYNTTSLVFWEGHIYDENAALLI